MRRGLFSTRRTPGSRRARRRARTAHSQPRKPGIAFVERAPILRDGIDHTVSGRRTVPRERSANSRGFKLTARMRVETAANVLDVADELRVWREPAVLAMNHKQVLRITREDNLLCLRKGVFRPTATDSRHAWKFIPTLYGSDGNESVMGCRHRLCPAGRGVCLSGGLAECLQPAGDRLGAGFASPGQSGAVARPACGVRKQST